MSWQEAGTRLIPSSTLERELKAAEEFFELAKNASFPLCRRTIANSLSGTFRSGRIEVAEKDRVA
jgi:hypothetical protein